MTVYPLYQQCTRLSISLHPLDTFKKNMGRHKLGLYIVEVFIYISLTSDGVAPFLVIWPFVCGCVYICQDTYVEAKDSSQKSVWAKTRTHLVFQRESFVCVTVYARTAGNSLSYKLVGNHRFSLWHPVSTWVWGQTQVTRCIQQVLLPAVPYP